MNAPGRDGAGRTVEVPDDLELARLLRHEGRGLADRLAGRERSWWAGAVPDGATRYAVVADLAARLAETGQSLEGRWPPTPLPGTDDPEVLVAQLAVTAEDVAEAVEAAVSAPRDARAGRTRADGTVEPSALPGGRLQVAEALVALLERRCALLAERPPERLTARARAAAEAAARAAAFTGRPKVHQPRPGEPFS